MVREVQPWWQVDGAVGRWVRDLVTAEMAVLRPQGWAWPRKQGDIHWADDAGIDSLEGLVLAGAFAEALDLSTEAELRALSQQTSWQGWTAIAQEQWAGRLRRAHFKSSGSTGRPSRFRHDLADLEQEMRALRSVLAQRGVSVQRIVSAVRCHHIYGFLHTLILPAVLGETQGHIPPVIDAVGLAPSGVYRQTRAGDLIIGFPDWWALALGSGTPWPAGVCGITSTAPCPPDVAAWAQAAGLAWLDIYGCSDLAGIAWRANPADPYVLHDFWRRARDTERLERDSAESNSLLERRAPEGHWRPAVTPPDHLDWVDSRRFRPVGRRDGVVQIGGVNVDPQQVRERLCRHPEVADAWVRPHRQTASGSMRLKAYVVPRAAVGGQGDVEGEAGTEAKSDAEAVALSRRLMDWCRQHLTAAERPVHITVGPALPRNELGKPRDWDIG